MKKIVHAQDDGEDYVPQGLRVGKVSSLDSKEIEEERHFLVMLAVTDASECWRCVPLGS